MAGPLQWTVANVLNVIPERKSRDEVIEPAANGARERYGL